MLKIETLQAEIDILESERAACSTAEERQAIDRHIDLLIDEIELIRERGS